jgi:uncharacterized protein YcgI (DUF1989 family)
MPSRVGDLILYAITVRLSLTDHQRAVAERLLTRSGAAGFDELAALAVDHERRRPPEPRWSRPRPPRPAVAHRSGEVVLDAVLPAASGVALALTRRQRLSLEQLKDGQCVDLSACAGDGRHLSAARSRAFHGINPSTGASLWSTAPHTRLLTIVADTSPGHDLCFPPCSELEYWEHSGIGNHLGCAELHAVARASFGAGHAAETDDVLNLWLPSAVDGRDGRLRSWPAACRRGDVVQLEAERDVFVVLSTCPDDLFGSSQYEPGPIRVVVSNGTSERAAASRPRRAPELPPGWPTAPPPSAVARHQVAVVLGDADRDHVDRIAAGGWLGTSRAAVLRALMFRLYESSRTAR